MSVQETRGGHPHVFLDGITTTGRKHRFPFKGKYLIIRVTTNPCKLYFTQADFNADTNFVTVPVPAAATPHGEWRGPLEANEVWLKATAGTSNVELVAFQRRG